MLLFVSNGKGGTGLKTEQWRTLYRKLIGNNLNGRIVELDCPHMMQDYEYSVVISRKILSYYRAHKASEIAEYLGISDSTYFRKKVLENLADEGYLERSKLSSAVFYKTIADMVAIC